MVVVIIVIVLVCDHVVLMSFFIFVQMVVVVVREGLQKKWKFFMTFTIEVVHILRNRRWGGGSLQMITVLHRGGPPNDYVITKKWCGK